MANLNLSEFGENTSVSNADYTFVWDSANSISKKVSRNSWLNSGTLTSDAPVTINQTWGTTGTYTAFKVVANETLGAATASNLLELWSGSTPTLKLKVEKQGDITFLLGNRTISGAGNISLGSYTSGAYLGNLSLAGATCLMNATGVYLGQSTELAWTNGASYNTKDTILVRDSASGNTLALRNGGAPQTFNVYGTSGTNNTDYRRLGLYCPTTGEATIQSQFSTPLVVTGGSAPSTTATITFAAQASAFPVGSTVVISGVTPSGYNGTYTVTASTTTSVSYTVAAALANWSSGGTAVVSGFTGTVSINGVPVGMGKGNVAGNIAIGTNTINATATGGNNIAIGTSALSNVTVGIYNIAIGLRSLFTQTVWGGNVAIGADALYLSLTGAEQNVAIGTGALYHNTSGFNTIAIGLAAGRQTSVGNNTGTVSNSVYLGANTKALDLGQTNQIVIGYDATGIGSNSVVLGNDSITKTALKGNVGIGTTAPGAKLQVVGNALFGENVSTAGSVINVSFGGSYGIATPGSKANLKWDLFNNGITSDRFGIGMSANLMEFQTGTGAGFGFYPNAGTTSALHIISSGNVGIGTTSPTSKLHVAGSSSPSITVDNTLATGASQLLFKNTVVTGDTDGIFLNGSAQSGFGGNGSLNIKATTGPLAFHTASVTNALSIAQSGAATFSGPLSVGSYVDCTEIRVDGSVVFDTTGATLLVGTGGFSGVNLGVGNVIIRIGGTTNLSPALKRSATTIQARLADDSAFAPIQGKLTTETAFTATTVTPTGFITLYDSTGAAYKVPCVPA